MRIPLIYNNTAWKYEESWQRLQPRTHPAPRYVWDSCSWAFMNPGFIYFRGVNTDWREGRSAP